MSKLDNKFKHNTWFKGQGYTVRQALDYFIKHDSDFCLTTRPSLKQSDNMLDDILYDYVIVSHRGFYRLSNEAYRYYINA